MKQLAVAILCLGVLCVHAYHNDAWANEENGYGDTYNEGGDAYARGGKGVGIGIAGAKSTASVWAPISNYSSVRGYQDQGMAYNGNVDIYQDGDDIKTFAFASAPNLSPPAGTVGTTWGVLGGLFSGGKVKEAPYATTQKQLDWLKTNVWLITGIQKTVPIPADVLAVMRATACQYKVWKKSLSYGGIYCKDYKRKARDKREKGPKMVPLLFREEPDDRN